MADRGGFDRFPTHRLGRVEFTVCPQSAAVEALLAEPARLAAAQASRGTAVHLANAYTVSLADRDPEYAAALAAGVNLTDGRVVPWFGHREAPALPWSATRGPALMRETLASSGPEGPAHFFLGGTPETLAELLAEVGRRWPGLRVAGSWSPPFRDLTAVEIDGMVARIAASRAGIVWVGLGTPKQDWFAKLLAGRLPVAAVAVGAAFDFIAGSQTEAPPWLQRAGLEWSYRLATEPRRLWRRYLVGNPRFVAAVVRGRRRESREQRDLRGDQRR